MTGALCFDIKKAPITENPLFCPFVLDERGEYAWIDEFLQQQESSDPTRPANYTSAVRKKKQEATCKMSVSVRQN